MILRVRSSCHQLLSFLALCVYGPASLGVFCKVDVQHVLIMIQEELLVEGLLHHLLLHHLVLIVLRGQMSIVIMNKVPLRAVLLHTIGPG